MVIHKLQIFVLYRANRTPVDKSKIFGANGPESTVARLYDTFASQFTRTDDERTSDKAASSTLLPTTFNYGVIEVAQVLKKITHGLESGLLGSVSLFEAFASILEKFQDADAGTRSFQAKLVALAITSVTSVRRKSYIIALLGLAAMIGHDAVTADNSDELMSHKKLGVVLGPCLLGAERSEEIKTETVGRDGRPVGEKERMIMQFEVAKRVTTMLTSLWEEVVKQLWVLEGQAPGPSRLSSVREDPLGYSR